MLGGGAGSVGVSGLSFKARREALCAPLREEAAALFTRWLALPSNAARFPSALPVHADEIKAEEVDHVRLPVQGRRWEAWLDREEISDLGPGRRDAQGSPVDALLMLVLWLEGEIALSRIRLAGPAGIGAWLFPEGQIERLGARVTLTPVNEASDGGDQMVRVAATEEAVA